MTVTAVWAVSYMVSIVNHQYHPPAEINGVMLLVAGFFFASGIREQGRSIAEEERQEMKHIIHDELERERAAHDD